MSVLQLLSDHMSKVKITKCDTFRINRKANNSSMTCGRYNGDGNNTKLITYCQHYFVVMLSYDLVAMEYINVLYSMITQFYSLIETISVVRTIIITFVMVKTWFRLQTINKN